MNFKELVESVLLLEVSISKANKERFIKKYNTDETIALDYLNKFNSLLVKLTNKDVFGYNDLKELDKALKQAQQTKTKRGAVKEAAIAGSKIIYEDNDCILRLIRSKEASIAYGKGTPWCISYDDSKPSEDERVGNLYWDYSLKQNKTIYILTAKRPIYDIARDVNATSREGQTYRTTEQFMSQIEADNVGWKKLAFLVEGDTGNIEVWNYMNEEIYNGKTIAPLNLFPNIKNKIKFIPFTEKELLPHLKQDVRVGLSYAYVTKKRVPEAEALLLRGGVSFEALEYAQFVIGGRWKEFEDLILRTIDHYLKEPSFFSSGTVVEYIKSLIPDRWSELEKLLKDKQLPNKLQEIYDLYRLQHNLPPEHYGYEY